MDWINQLRKEGDYVTRLASDLEFFAAERLKIRPKVGSLAPFIFNPAQRELHRNVLSDNPTYLAGARRIYEGMRMAGVPEQ